MCKVSIQIRSHFCHFYPIRVSSFLLSFTSITRFERRKVMAKEVNLLKACLDEDDPMDMLRASPPEKNTHQNTLRFSSFFYCNPFEILFSALQILLLLQCDYTIGASHCRTTYHPVNHYDNPRYIRPYIFKFLICYIITLHIILVIMLEANSKCLRANGMRCRGSLECEHALDN